jgi:hypothetical protein
MRCYPKTRNQVSPAVGVEAGQIQLSKKRIDVPLPFRLTVSVNTSTASDLTVARTSVTHSSLMPLTQARADQRCRFAF